MGFEGDPPAAPANLTAPLPFQLGITQSAVTEMKRPSTRRHNFRAGPRRATKAQAPERHALGRTAGALGAAERLQFSLKSRVRRLQGQVLSKFNLLHAVVNGMREAWGWGKEEN